MEVKLSTILYAFGLCYALWTLYLLVMGLYRAKLTNRLSKTATVLGAPFLILGYALDVVANLTVASVLFVELPGELLVTSRLIRHIKKGSGWRKKLAEYICANLLDPFDPTGSHCYKD